ncbi:MAG: glycosyltransferase family 4 protein [Planctomycetaceae bacterium]
MMTAIRTFSYGSNRMMFHYATALREAGHEVTFAYEAVPTPEDVRTGELLPELQAAGISTVHIPRLSRAMIPGMSGGFAREVRQREIDLIISTQLRDAPGTMAVAVRCGIPGVVFAQGAPYFQGSALSRFAKRSFYRRALRSHARRIVCVAPAIRDRLVQQLDVPADKLTVVLNGLNPDTIPAPDSSHRASVRREFGFADDEFIFITIGRFDEVKGLDILVDAVERIVRSGTAKELARFKVIIAAEAYCPRSIAYRESIERMIEKAGLTSYFVFPGFRSDCNRLLQAADSFLLPSRSEGMPLVVLEAFAAGCPVVMSEYGERFAGFHDGSDGFYVPVEDAGALADAMARMMQLSVAERRDIGIRGRHYLKQNLTLKGGQDKFADVIQRVLGKSVSGSQRLAEAAALSSAFGNNHR